MKVIDCWCDGHWQFWRVCVLIALTQFLERIMYETIALHVTRRSGLRLTALTNVALVVFGSVLIALLAQVRVMLPFSPVPFTGQTLGVLLVAAVLGWKRGVGSLVLYLGEGMLGLPVFAGGAAGLAYLGGPTGGYLFGFVIAAGLVGWLAERGWDRHWSRVALMFVLGMLVVYACGTSYLALFLGLRQAVTMGILPFLLTDVLKAGLAAIVLPWAWKLLRTAE